MYVTKDLIKSNWKDRTNSVFTHAIALDVHSVRTQVYVVVFLATVETQSVQSELEFWAHAD